MRRQTRRTFSDGTITPTHSSTATAQHSEEDDEPRKSRAWESLTGILSRADAIWSDTPVPSVKSRLTNQVTRTGLVGSIGQYIFVTPSVLVVPFPYFFSTRTQS